MSWLKSSLETVLGLDQNPKALTSNWGSLHNDLIAVFTQLDLEGNPIGESVKAVVKDGEVQQEFNWGSPFEDMTAEQKHPTFMAAAQSGALSALGQSLEKSDEQKAQEKSEQNGIIQKMNDFAKKAEGRTGITKINSRQVFTGHPPLKLTATLLFRAWQDPESEVAKPFFRLQEMAYPSKLAEIQTDAMVQAWNDFKTDGAKGMNMDTAVDVLFPSHAPLLVQMTYKNETYPPMVIESLSKPLDAPYSVMGDIWLEVPIVLATRQSLDFEDVKKMKKNQFWQQKENIDAFSNLFK